ncbi:dead-like helicase [Flavobacterium columnare ATCC 49512]|uniref:Dead-like helicase n=1 Tax=Flavobacterium columnare (strain ATCC 49512 / CIP 103533 / TG 44/87) TaxID=1041826 RepID=G8X7Y9_FLACA|nr:DEAD/DEAH box helicase family protein [Flavobacterium columnare]AEW87103.1 dead-like helicase [Flavobacterium columnare ATCC 49512]
MNIFKKINEQQKNSIEQPIDPNELFYSLKKDKDYSYLRGIQEEALTSFHNNREKKHLLFKMNTGAGKTLVGLLMLYSKMIETKKRSIFLCPDKQLVNQVFEQSKKYNIPTCTIDIDNELPEEFLNNKAILITTIQKLFNGKNIFDKYKIEIETIVIDDAHKCIEKIRDSFTIKIPREHKIYENLFRLFTDELKRQAIGSYEAIKTDQPDYYMKLPFWTWIDNRESVIKILSKHLDEVETLLFKWDLFHNNYNQYELYIKSSQLEITPIKCFSNNIQTYSKANFIYALSATFENDSNLLFDLDFTKDSILNPIEPKDRKDYGQRLILTPQRYFKEFTTQNLIEIINHHKENNQNILVLVPSFREAKMWNEIGARIINEDIENEINNLKNSKGNFVVIANRYDGIDLGGDACNVLIIYEHPNYKFIKDRYYETILHKTNTNIIAQTIEQGLGRTVRSGNDYSVIYLLGKNILRFLRYKENFKYLNKHTRKQIEIGLDLLSQEDTFTKENFSKILCETADFCLSQNEDWLIYYQNFMKDVDNEAFIFDKNEILEIKELERIAILEFVYGNPNKSLEFIQSILNKNISNSERAIYTILYSNICYLIDKNLSNDMIIKAREYSRYTFDPFLSQEYIKKQLKFNNQILNAYNYIKSFSTLNDAIDIINDIISGLKYDPNNSSEKFEESLRLLGKLIGFNSFRPEKEKNEGCDNLWLIEDGICLIMESKSEKLNKNLISKDDIGQLMNSINWFNDKYLNENIEYYGITLQYNRKKERDVVINDRLKVIDFENLEKIKNSLYKYIDFLSKNNLNNISQEQIKAEFNSYNFLSKQFISNYITKIQ